MLSELSYTDFLKLASQNRDYIIVYKEFLNDTITPITAYQAVAKDQKNSVILESSLFDPLEENFSYIGVDAISYFEVFENKIVIKEKDSIRETNADPINALRLFVKKYHCESNREQSGIAGCAIGYMSYDAIRFFEKIEDKHFCDNSFPEMSFKVFATSIGFHHKKNKITISNLTQVKNNPEAAYSSAFEKINTLARQIFKNNTSSQTFNSQSKNNIVFSTDISDEEFEKKVLRAKEYIQQGEVFQIVLSRTFKSQYSCPEFDIYRALRLINPSQYMFYIADERFVLTGSSPEKLVSVKNGLIETVPIAGTRARKNPEFDEMIENELLTDEKENAEHMMLVDLSRNDLGKCAEVGSVNVTQLKKIKKLSHVMHMVSHVNAKIKQSCDALDALKAVFPAGTLSGAPKIRAMQLIDELENSRRGFYGGMVGMLDHQGNFDSCITIRSVLLKNGEALVRAGAGIVHDSIPENEAQETLHKANSVLAAIALAQGGVS